MKNNLYIYYRNFSFNKAIKEEKFKEALEYLEDENMKNYLEDYLLDKIEEVRWKLEDNRGGKVIIKSKEPLSFFLREKLVEFIEGQESDGLGSGFEQLDFAIEEEIFFDSDEEELKYLKEEEK